MLGYTVRYVPKVRWVLVWIGLWMLWGTVGCETTSKVCVGSQDCSTETPVCVSGKCVACRSDRNCNIGYICKNNVCIRGSSEVSKEYAHSEVPRDSSSEPKIEPLQERSVESTSEPTKEQASEPRIEPSKESSQPDGGADPEPIRESKPEIKPIACTRPTECPVGAYCRNGSCTRSAECLSDSACTDPKKPVCVDGYCSVKQPGCRANGQCLPGTLCHNSVCVPGPKPAQCKVDSECPGNMKCVAGKCIWNTFPKPKACTANSQCLAGYTCSFGFCQRKCKKDTDCWGVSLTYCHAGTCIRPNYPKGECRADSDCLPRQYCAGQTCRTCKEPPQCITHTDCKRAGQMCSNGQCGFACKSDGDCSGRRGGGICAQQFCRGEGLEPVGCSDDPEIPDLIITGIRCVRPGFIDITIQNIGVGPAVGRFYLCREGMKGGQFACVESRIANFGANKGIIKPRALLVEQVGWKLKKGDILHVDQPNIILEKRDDNNQFVVQKTCP